MNGRAKLEGSWYRFRDAIRWWPRRWRRLGRHFLRFCWFDGFWWLEVVYLLLDLAAVPELYETLTDWLKWNTRPLRAEERALLEPLFGDSIDYDRVRIDERALIGPPQWRICYVSFYTINAWGKMSPDLLIHETVHIWQFTQLGSVYIPRALRAQYSQEGYNYGGAPRVATWAGRGALLQDFNLEQQADLVADYWRLSRGIRPHWGPAGPADLPAYAYFVRQLTS